eukprot:Plantae.Rhodophyta-Palmaria_palmata.ctg5137.p1 GENE.Plantae.Rhodophyta-Palmaria_palmata.ctg5137~~Plantae.Rhodophyta-Palmaria_palmata.ctg5137.p1  ORF type:complete len:394 (+),score=115.10 Plantae.Rhodophyta-Palmaria_palmata.ctg5137:142-1182(+)
MENGRDQKAIQCEKLKSKKILKDLRSHQEELRQNKDAVHNPRNNELAKHFKRAESNAKKSKNVSQKYLDAQILNDLGGITKKQAQLMTTGLKDVDVTTFIDKLNILMKAEQQTDEDMSADGDEEAAGTLDLHSLGADLCQLFASFPSINFLHGNRDIEPKVQKARAAPKEKKKAEVTKPAEVHEADTVEITETDREVKEMMKLLKAKKTMNFWKFVVDPNNFGRTIENAFHVSFLVKDGHAKLDLESEPNMITLREQRSSSEDADEAKAKDEEDNAQNSQFILKLDYNVWKGVTEKYNITECLLPSRGTNADGELVPKDESGGEGGYEDEDEEMGESEKDDRDDDE